MHIERQTEQIAIGWWTDMKKKYHIYRKLSSGKYVMVGAIYWKINYSAVPIKEKYFNLMFFSQADYGREVIPE